MEIIFGLVAVVAIMFWCLRIVDAVCFRNIALQPHRNWIVVSLFVWCVVTGHRAGVWIPSLGGVGGYDGTGHEKIARNVAEQLNSGTVSLTEMDFLSNEGYRNLLGLFYALTAAPNFLACAFHAMLAFCGLLFTLEAVAIATKQARIPWWFAAYVMLLPTALIFTPCILKEAPALWGIGVLIRFGVSPEHYLKNLTSIITVGLGALTVFLMRPHIGGAWMVAVAASHSISFKKPVFTLVALAGAFGGYLLTMATAEMVTPGFSDKVNDVGLVETLDEMTDHAQGGSAIYRETTPVPFLNGLIFVFLEPNPLYWGNPNYAIVGIEVWFLTIVLIWNWSKMPNKIRLLASPNGLLCIFAILALSFYLGYMYNMGLMVRQRLQVMPALILLASLPLRFQGSNNGDGHLRLLYTSEDE